MKQLVECSQKPLLKCGECAGPLEDERSKCCNYCSNVGQVKLYVVVL